ncbi:hypothetical protein FANTH_8532 [Fusarium anthophilum]|uniref:WSC domain-containing protein n=1 Tax=Fusarium anthophilum TaxID=48485 RepID=A0A8H5E163_9HYPO|nr:hypothetical protein FANTH_8532 [Fusarium anthophilum]
MARLNLLHAALFFWVALVAAQSVKLDRLTHQGCLQGRQPLHFALAGSSRTEKHLRECLNTCERKGQPLVAFGTDHCFCSDDVPLDIPSLDNDRCNVNCQNGLNDNCIRVPEGSVPKGEMLFNVFKIGPRQFNGPKRYAKGHGKLGKITAQGCYDVKARPSSPEHIRIVNYETRLECARFCAAEGKPLALIGAACYCVKSYPRFDLAAQLRKCYLPCFSDEDETCRRPYTYMPPYQRKNLERDYISVYDTGLGVDVEIDPSWPTDEEEDEIPKAFKMSKVSKEAPEASEASKETASEPSDMDQPPKQPCHKAEYPSPLSHYFKDNTPAKCHHFCSQGG